MPPLKTDATQALRHLRPVRQARSGRQDLRRRRGGYGLTLRVTPNGVKYWYQRVRLGNRMTNVGPGGYPLVTLAEARDAAIERNAPPGAIPRPLNPLDR